MARSKPNDPLGRASLFRQTGRTTKRSAPGVELFSSPWKSVRLAGWRLPLILDTQGVVLHAGLMQDLFGDREAGAAEDRPGEQGGANGNVHDLRPERTAAADRPRG